MGAYLYYKLSDKKQADEYNKFISETNNGKRLIKAEHLIAVYDSSDIEWAKKNRPDMIRFFKEQIGKRVVIMANLKAVEYRKENKLILMIIR